MFELVIMLVVVVLIGIASGVSSIAPAGRRRRDNSDDE